MPMETEKHEDQFAGRLDDLPPVPAPGHGGTTKRIVFGPGRFWDDHVVRFFTTAPGQKSPAHTHDWPHYLLFLEGQARGLILGKVYEFTSGSWAYIPSNTEHFLENTGTGDLKFICIVPKKGDQSVNPERKETGCYCTCR